MRILVGLALCVLLVVGLAWMLGQGQGDPSSVMEVRPGSGTRLDPQGPTPTDAPDDRATESATPASRVAAPEPPEASRTRQLRLRGRVLDDVSGEPLAGLRMQAFALGPGWSPVEVTDEEGLFESSFPEDGGEMIVRCLGEADDSETRWSIEPKRVEVNEALVAEAVGQPIEFRAGPPVGVLTVRILMPDGSPALACRVGVNRGAEAGYFSWGSAEPAGSGGIWRKTLYRRDLQEPVHLEALKLEGKLRSGVMSLRPPFPSESVVLRLVESAEVRGRVMDVDGSPIEGVAIHVFEGPPEGERRIAGFSADTNGAGSYVVYALRPGEYTLRAYHALTLRFAEKRLSLLNGTRHSCDLRLAESPVQMALSGKILQDVGGGLGSWGSFGVHVEVLGVERSDGVRTSYSAGWNGYFEIWLPPAEEVEIRVGGKVWSDRFEPDVRRFAFGTKEVEIRPVEVFASRTLRLDIRDADSGDRITEPKVWVRNSSGDCEILGSKPRTAGESHRRPRLTGAGHLLGPFEVVKANPDLQLGITAEGYQSCVRRLGDLQAGDGYVLEAALEPGYAATLVVVDSKSGDPIEGAEAKLGDELLGVSDAQGRMRLELSERPEDRLRITCSDHRKRHWKPEREPWEQRITMSRSMFPSEPYRDD